MHSAWVMIQCAEYKDGNVNIGFEMKPIITCKECRYSQEQHPFTNCLICHGACDGKKVTANDFCSDGRAKDGESDD